MTEDEMGELYKLVKEYDLRFGTGKGEIISGSLMFSFSIEEQIMIFKKAKAREILWEVNPDVIDGIVILYK